MSIPLVGAPFMLRAGALVLNLMEVASVRFDRPADGSGPIARVLYHGGFSETYSGEVAQALDDVFPDYGTHAASLRKEFSYKVVPPRSSQATWEEPARAEDCRCQTDPTATQ